MLLLKVKLSTLRMLVSFNCNMMGTNSGAGTAYPSGAPTFTHCFYCDLCCSIVSFWCNFSKPLFFFWPCIISTNYQKIILKFFVLCGAFARTGTILSFARKLTHIEIIILESNLECSKVLLYHIVDVFHKIFILGSQLDA